MPAQPNASLHHGLDCLRTVVTAGSAIGSREVARRLGLVHTRANRLLGTLAQLGLVEQNAQRKYRIGPALHVLAAQSLQASRLLPAALPRLAPWHRDGFTIALGVLWQDQVCFLVHARPGAVLHESIGRHELWPAEQTAVGLALLACRPGAAGGSPRSSDGLAAGEEDLAACLERTRRDGYAIRRWAAGETSLGAAVGDPAIAAIAISHSHLDPTAIPDLADRLRRTAGAIAAEAGGPA